MDIIYNNKYLIGSPLEGEAVTELIQNNSEICFERKAGEAKRTGAVARTSAEMRKTGIVVRTPVETRKTGTAVKTPA